MYIKSCVFFVFVIFCVIYGNPTTFKATLIRLANEKCPLYESLAVQSLFLDGCSYSSTLKFSHVGRDNEKIVLCSMYYNVFENFCVRTNSKLFKSWGRNLQKEFKQVPQEFSSNISEVCNSLKLINSTILSPTVINFFNNTSKCQRICTDFEENVIDICSLTSFVWNLTESYFTIENSFALKQKPDNPQTLSATSLKPPNIHSKTVINSSNSLKGVESNNSAIISYQTTNSKSYSTIDYILNEFSSSTPVTNVKTNNSIAQNTQVVEPKFDDKDYSQHNNETVSNLHSNGLPASNITLPSNEKELHAGDFPSTVKSAQEMEGKKEVEGQNSMKSEIHTTEALRTKTNDLGTGEEQNNAKNKITISQVEVHQEDNNDDKKEDTKVDDLNIYDDDDELVENNEPPSPQKVTKANEDKPKDDAYELLSPKSSEVKTKVEVSKPKEIDEDSFNIAANYQNQNIDDSNSYFFSYFMMICVLFICGYVAYHNKQKILALVLEGRKGRRPSRTRRPNSSNYRKLDSTLEEAVTSSCNKNTTQVIY